MKQALWVVVTTCLAGLLVGCGGGGNSPQPASGSGAGAAKSAKAPLCAPGTTLPFDYKKAANVKDADGKAIGADGASKAIGELGESDSVCTLAVSADTQKVIDDAHALVQQGRKTEAKALVDSETTRVIALPSAGAVRFGTRGMGLAATDKDKIDQKVRDLVGLGGAAQDAGDDGARQLAEAQALYGPKLEERLKSADWQEAIRIAAEAEKLGLDDLQKRAIAKGKSEIAKMADDARKNFDVCLSTDAQMKKIVTLLALAQLLDVDSAVVQTITSLLNDTAAANVLLHTNKLPPECARWNIKLTAAGELHDNGGAWSYSVSWTGTFSVGKTGKVEGTAVGLWSMSGRTCIIGNVGKFTPASGSVKVTISGDLEDEKFHLAPDTKVMVNPEGCVAEDAIAAIIGDILGTAVDLFAQESGEEAIVIPAKDGAVASREVAESGGSFKIAVAITKRQGGGN